MVFGAYDSYPFYWNDGANLASIPYIATLKNSPLLSGALLDSLALVARPTSLYPHWEKMKHKTCVSLLKNAVAAIVLIKRLSENQ